MFLSAIPFVQSQLKINRLNLLFFFIFLLTVSRGIIEIAIPKKFAMIFHFGGVAALCTLLLYPRLLFISRRQKQLLILIILFLIESFLSCLATYTQNEMMVGLVYTFFNAALFGIVLLALRDFSPNELPHGVPFIFLSIGWILLVVGLGEQFKLLEMPGEGKMYVIRPASLTGSFLHYPIVMALLGYLCIQWYSLSKKRVYLWSGILFGLSTIVCCSRSGALIVLAAVFFYPFVIPFKKAKTILIIQAVFVVLLTVTFLSYSKESKTSLFHNVIYRVFSSFDTKSAGNKVRVAIWRRTSSEWLDTNLLIGEKAGRYTNATHNLRKGQGFNKGKVTESSLLQLLLNYGLAGMVLFYAILFQIMRFIDHRHYWMKAVFLAAMAQTLVYQSIEVVPFILLLSLFPWISQCMKTQLGAKGSEIDKNGILLYDSK